MNAKVKQEYIQKLLKLGIYKIKGQQLYELPTQYLRAYYEKVKLNLV
ncbi:Fur-regulated basic protein FbpA [Pullulanibacillus pueri]|nr:Fur-regulated basic protein FbpA [Pullulanibacillus pueri]